MSVRSDDDAEFRRLATIRVIRESVRVRLEPVCQNLSMDEFDHLIDDIALVQYRYEGPESRYQTPESERD